VDLERFQVANLASPLVTATFASSPSPAGADEELVSVRARAWQELDPTRTGFPRHVTDGPFDDPQQALSESALAADVLLFRRADGGADAGEPGFRFLDWMTAGHPEHGWPTLDDLDYHLTTLFHEVRCRGFFELRAGEALPEPWGVAPVVLQTGLLYDAEARAAAKALLWPHRGDLHELWVRAARNGVRDPLLGELCVRTWELALLGARRLRTGYFEEAHLARAEEFLSRFTRQGRMPADELKEALSRCDAEALAWCAGDAPCGEPPAPGKGLAIA
jgi:glutamate--cysteine ligase